MRHRCPSRVLSQEKISFTVYVTRLISASFLLCIYSIHLNYTGSSSTPKSGGLRGRGVGEPAEGLFENITVQILPIPLQCLCSGSFCGAVLFCSCCLPLGCQVLFLALDLASALDGPLCLPSPCDYCDFSALLSACFCLPFLTKQA